MKNVGNREDLMITKEIWKERISISKKKVKVPYWINLIRVLNLYKGIIFQKWVEFLVLKDRKVFDKKERPEVSQDSVDCLAVVSEGSIIQIEVKDFEKIKENALVLSDRTEKQISSCVINGLGKSRYLKGVIECIFNLRNHIDDFNWLDIQDFKCEQSDKQRIVKRIEHEIRKASGLSPKSKLPQVPEEWSKYVEVPEILKDYFSAHGKLLDLGMIA